MSCDERDGVFDCGVWALVGAEHIGKQSLPLPMRCRYPVPLAWTTNGILPSHGQVEQQTFLNPYSEMLERGDRQSDDDGSAEGKRRGYGVCNSYTETEYIIRYIP